MEISLHLFLEEKQKVTYQDSVYRIIFDISKELFFEKVEYLYHHLLYPLYLHRKKIIPISFPNKIEKTKISPDYLHTNVDAIWMHLYLEAWYLLIEEEVLLVAKNGNYKQLNVEQKKAVRRIFGPVCLIAPAGSGKTKTLITRVEHLLYQGIKSENILVLVFNKKAEEEIKIRLDTASLEVRTFHSFCYQILKENTNYELYGEDTTLFTSSLLEEIIMQNKTVFGNEQNLVDSYIKMLAKVENELLKKEGMSFEVGKEKKDFYPVLQSYLDLLKREEMVSFDDLLYLTVRLLLENGHLRRILQKKYQYILVDEFQDLNPIQLFLVRILALPQNHLFVVGDDDQMIYGFRGASVKPILEFSKMYPRCYQLSLKWNYRSSKRIVLHAKEFISHNFMRVSKDFTSYQTELGNISLFIAKNFMEEANEVVKWLEARKTDDVAIIYRYREYGVFLQFFLEAKGYVLNTNESFQKTFPFLVCLLECMLEPFEPKKARKLCMYLKKRYPPTVTTKEDFLAYLGERFLSVQTLLGKKDISFRTFCFLLRFKEEAFFPSTSNEEYVKNFLNSFTDMFQGVKGLYRFIKRKKKRKTRLEITCATIHQVKGREYDSVCYFHMERGKIDEIEEERRVSYVALTRAKKNIIITASRKDVDYVKEYFCFSNLEDQSDQEIESRIEELQKELIDIRKKINLLQKDQESLKEHFLYEVREEGLKYFCSQVSSLEKIKAKEEKRRQELFFYQEEKNARCLVFPKKK